jgi:hypothetical protein
VKKYVVLLLLSLIIAPVTVSAANYLLGDRRGNWQTVDRSSAGLLANASEHPDALIRVFAARTVRWCGIFAVHSWIVVKERSASRYSRYDYTAWGPSRARRITGPPFCRRCANVTAHGCVRTAARLDAPKGKA